MANTSFKLIRKPRDPGIQSKIIRAEVVKKLEPVAQAAVIARRRVVANWSNKPDFAYKISVKPNLIRIIINLSRPKRLTDSNANTNDLWKWLDMTGTKAHSITPKRPTGILVFPWGGPGSYQSKTGANPARYGGPGTVRNAETQYRKIVSHPGFKPRHFSEAINRDLRPKFNQAIDSGYRAGLKKASKANG